MADDAEIPTNSDKSQSPAGLRVLLVMRRYDGDDPMRGLAFETRAFEPALRRLGCQVFRFDPRRSGKALGIGDLNLALQRRIDRLKPDVVLASLRRDWVHPKTIAYAQRQGIPTLNWYSDDHWQFDTVSRRWTPHFDSVATTSLGAMQRYAEHGWMHAHHSQWACDPKRFVGYDGPRDIDMLFIGARYGDRARKLERLANAGVDIHAFGDGWPAGRVGEAEMAELMLRAKIVVNFADASTRTWTVTQRFVRTRHAHRLRMSPLVWRLALKLDERAHRHNAQSVLQSGTPQIKGRVFEATAAGACLLTEPAENLEDYLRPGREAMVFHHEREMIAMARDLLADEAKREGIAEAGRLRTHREHTWDQRLATWFEAAGIALAQPGVVESDAELALAMEAA